MLINKIIASVGDASVRVENPYLYLTKGQVCRRALSAGLDVDALAATISCGHPPNVRHGAKQEHCGYCMPCLIRRSALLASAGDMTRYEYAFWELDMRDDKAADAIALCTWLARPFTMRDLVADVSIDSDVAIPDLMTMLHAGRRELASMIATLVPAEHPLRILPADTSRR